MASGSVRASDIYTDRRGRRLIRCPDEDGINNHLFVTVQSPFLQGVDTSSISDLEIIRTGTPVLERIFTSILGSYPFNGSSNLHIVGFFQRGSRSTHAHIHFMVNQKRDKKYTNLQIFDSFKTHFRDPVLKSTWCLDGLVNYLCQVGTIVVFRSGDTSSFPLDEDAVDAPSSSSFNLRVFVKNVMDKNPSRSSRSLHNLCMSKGWKFYKKTTVDEAFENWCRSRQTLKYKEEVEEADPLVTESVLVWIALQHSKKNCNYSGSDVEEFPVLLEKPAFYHIYDFYTRVCNEERRTNQKCLWMYGVPGIGKSNSWQWMTTSIDYCLFNPGAHGVGKYDGCEYAVLAISDDTTVDMQTIVDSQYTTLLNIMSGGFASIKVHGRTTTNSRKLNVLFVSNGMPKYLPLNFKRRVTAIECISPHRNFWDLSEGKYSNVMLYNYFKQARKDFLQGKYTCYCAMFVPLGSIDCPAMEHPKKINCPKLEALTQYFSTHGKVCFEDLGFQHPFELWKTLSQQEISEDSTSKEATSSSSSTTSSFTKRKSHTRSQEESQEEDSRDASRETKRSRPISLEDTHTSQFAVPQPRSVDSIADFVEI